MVKMRLHGKEKMSYA
jgi:hypothetical protein